MKLIEDWVECEYEGDVHTNMDDPYQYGPKLWYPPEKGDDEGYRDDPAWTLVKNHPDYTERKLWFYKCPGPHRLVWSGKVVT